MKYPFQLLSIKDIVAFTGLSKSTIRRMVLAQLFPAPIEASVGRKAWDSEAVEKWHAERQRSK